MGHSNEKVGDSEQERCGLRILRRHKISGWRRHALIRLLSRRSPAKADRVKNSAPNLRKPAPHARRRGLRITPSRPFVVRPDFVFRAARVALFVDGCFWHACPRHSNLPANNRAFWRKKLRVNRDRDRLVNRTLKKSGWKVLRIWEHDLRHPQKCLARLRFS